MSQVCFSKVGTFTSHPTPTNLQFEKKFNSALGSLGMFADRDFSDADFAKVFRKMIGDVPVDFTNSQQSALFDALYDKLKGRLYYASVVINRKPTSDELKAKCEQVPLNDRIYSAIQGVLKQFNLA